MSHPLRDVCSAKAEELAKVARVHPLTARCLIARGAESGGEVERFLEPKLKNLRPPSGLADLDRAVDRIATAITTGQTVGVFGDYDVDGVTTAALLSSAIEALGGRSVARVAKRSAGYGFTLDDASFFADSYCHLVITGDCGTSDLDAISEANRRGLDVIVVDHHTVPESASAHPSYALINPFRPDSSFEFTGFASVGLSFYVMQRVRSALRARGHFKNGRREPDLRHWLDLVAVGTIADLVPLTDENRIMTAAGLWVLGRRKRPGLALLLRNAGVEADADVGTREVGWKIAPRLNAPGRLGDADPALRLLLARTAEEAEPLAEALEQSNDDRRTAQDAAYAEALEVIEREPPGSCAVVAGRGWKPGVVGIVAARLVDLLERPVFAIAIDDQGVARGSARSFGGVNVYQALATCADLVSRFGGHAAAAGLTMDPERIGDLRRGLELAVARQRETLPPTLDLADGEVAIGELVIGKAPSELAKQLESLRPFGKGNPEVQLVARGLEVLEARSVGAGGDHLKLVLGDGNGAEIGAIGFGLGTERPELGARVDIVCSPLINRWRGTERAELQIHSLQAAVVEARVDVPGDAGVGARVVDAGVGAVDAGAGESALLAVE